MCEDLGLDPVLQRRDDRAAVGIVLGVRGEHELDVQREAQLEPADLHIAFLQDIEERHLDPRLQIGQFVDDEDAAVAARDEPEMDHPLVAVVELQVGGLDGIAVADEVGHGGVRRGELLAVTLVAVQPFDRRFVAVLRDQLLGVA